MAELVVVVPMGKCDRWLADDLLGSVFRLWRPGLVIDMFGGANGRSSIQPALDEAGAYDVGYAAGNLVARASTRSVWLDSSGPTEFASRPDALEVLLRIVQEVVALGTNVAVLTPWWVHRDEHEDGFRRALHAADLVVGVAEGNENHFRYPASHDLATDVAEAVVEAASDRARFVIVHPSGGGDRFPLLFQDPLRTVVLKSRAELWSSGGFQRLADLVGREVPLDERPPVDLHAALDRYGLSDAYIPEGLGGQVRNLDPDGTGSLYAFGTRPVDAADAYMFDPVVTAHLDGDPSTGVQVSAWGHGINSYAHSYTLVQRDLIVIAQVNFGGLTDREQTATSWRSVMTAVRTVREELDTHPLPDGQWLFIAHSDFRGAGASGLIQADQTPEERRAGLHAAEDPWEAARGLILGRGERMTHTPAPVAGARQRVSEIWDHVLAEWMEGREVWHSPEFEDLGRWFHSYAARVDLQHYPDPYVGDLLGKRHEPRLVLLGLNPGVGYDNLQARGGEWAEGIRLHGYSNFHDRIPFQNPVWTRLHGKDSPYWRNLVTFSRRWTQDAEFSPHDVLNIELYPWHSDRVEGAFRPPQDVLDRYVWEPLAELDQQVLFAFGKPWLEVCERAGLARVAWLGDHPDAQAPLPTANWNVVVFALPTGQHVVISWQAGYAGPPGPERALQLRAALGDLQLM